MGVYSSYTLLTEVFHMRTPKVPELKALVDKMAGATVPRNGSRPAAAQRRKDLRLARTALAGSKLDLKALDALARERAAARGKLTEAARSRAVKGSTAAARRLKRLTPAPDVPLAVVAPWEPGSFVVDTVTFVRTSADAGSISDSHVGPQDNWAKYRLRASADSIGHEGTGRLSFFTLWRNPRDQNIVANVSARFKVNAHLASDADWNGVAAWFIDGSEARAAVRARITLWALWASSVQAVVSDVILGSVGASGEFFGDDDSRTISTSQLLSGAGFSVPAEAYVLIEVSVVTEHYLQSGSIDFDAQSGSFRIDVPYLIVTIP
jgi:hypothetical protein